MVRMKEGQEVPAEVIDNLVISDRDFTEARKSVEPSAMRELYIEVPEIPWDMVAGLDQVKYEIEKVIEWPLKRKEAFEKLRIRPPKGILLFGPPGTGKTLLAKAIAAKSRMNFIAIKGPELLSKWVGDSEKQVREAFRKARQSAPAIIFFDEIDALVQKRGNQSGTSRVGESVLSQILTEMDGIEELKDVIVLAATNRPDMLDPAILRPGRLEKHLYIPAPDEKAREAILSLYCSDIRDLFDSSVSIPELAGQMQYYVGADIQAFVRELKLIILEEIFSRVNDPDDQSPVRIYPEHIGRALETVQGTLGSKTLELFEIGGWEILYPRSRREILMRAAMIINRADKQALIRALPPVIAATLAELRDLTFWQEKNYSRIGELSTEIDSFLSNSGTAANSS
jgi:transitional endoplasmic reticulum ATPase